MSNEGFLPLDAGFATRAVHEGQGPDLWKSKAIVPPVTLSSTFKLNTQDISKGYQYGRWQNPSREILENCLASLDEAKYGMCFSSGMAAISGILQLLKVGDNVICAHDVYGSTHYHLTEISTSNGIEVTFVDFASLSNFEKAIKSNTKLVWVESPSNPILNVVDIPAVSKICKKRSDDILLVVDNTFLTPYYQKPLALGADMAMYSLAKYMNGHDDVIMGSVTTNREDLKKKLHIMQNYMGIIPSPFDCYLVIRGLKTLSLRMKQHMENCWETIKHLQSHPLVEKVVHPAMPDHPQHAVFTQQSSGYSGMLAFYIRGASIKQTMKFLEALKYFQFAGGLGGVESLAAFPWVQSHSVVPEEERLKLGVTENLIRLSIGIETISDLLNDLDQALDAAFCS